VAISAAAEVLGGARLKAKAAQGDETFARSREHSNAGA